MSGRGTFSGTNFQGAVGACVAGLLLTERPLSRLASGLPGTPKKIHLETKTGVDDVIAHTECGTVFFQAKSTVVLSTKGELASVAAQFVHQFNAGVLEYGIRRELDPARDRLVLAVGPEAASTVANDLRIALDRHRTHADTDQPAKYLKALAVFSQLLDAAWLTIQRVAITPAEQRALLDLCVVVAINDTHRHLIEEALTHLVATPGDEEVLLDLLVKWATDAAEEGTGGDEVAIRLKLNGKVQLQAPPSFGKDIRRLQEYSQQTLNRLERFSTIRVAEGEMRLARPFEESVVGEAARGTLAVTGEPGAGKSAVLWSVASKLRLAHPVLCLAVTGGANNLDALRREIGLEHPLLDVLKQIPGGRPAYLIIDALDASRGGSSEETYRNLLEAVALLPDWRVIASVRTFDLKLGKAWQRLFPGPAPMSKYADKDLGMVRHLHLGLLDDAERADLARHSPSLAAALVAGGEKLERLARNPFNLELLAELLCFGVRPGELARMATRSQLLHRYWQARIEELGTDAYLGLAALVKRMLKARAVTLPLARLKSNTGEAIDNLQRAGVLLQGGDRIEFRHHILFDYAVARLALLPDLGDAQRHFQKQQAAGLLLAPSLGYWLEGIKQERSAQEFWHVVASLIAERGIDPIVRAEILRLTIESIPPTESLAELAAFFRQGTTLATHSFRLWVVALLSYAEDRMPFEVRPWVQLLGQLGTPPDEQLAIAQTLLDTLLGASPDAGAMATLGRVARNLFERIASDDSLSYRLAPFLIPSIARTYATDPAASRRQLDQLFEAKRFAKFGHREVPVLARKMLLIAPCDTDLVVQLYYYAFQDHEFSRHELTAMMSTFMLTLNTDVAQAFSMAKYELTEKFPELLRRFPATGIRALTATLRGERQRHQPLAEIPARPMLPVAGIAYAFEEDGSVGWADEMGTSYTADYAKMYQVFREQLPAIQQALAPKELAERMLKESGIALVWRVLFEAGAADPTGLGLLMWTAAASEPALFSPSTWESAVTLLAMVYPHLAPAARKHAEETWLAGPPVTAPDSESMRAEVLGRLFEAIGEATLATPEARSFLETARESRERLAGEMAQHLHQYAERNQGWSGPATESGAVECRQLTQKVRAALAAVRHHPTLNSLDQLQQAITALEEARGQRGDSDEGAVDALAQGTIMLLAYLPAGHPARAAVVAKLLALTQHPLPATDSTTEAEFAASRVHNFSQARIIAAQALATAAALTGLWPAVAARFEDMLLRDPHPAVRCQLAEGLPALLQVDEAAAWRLTAAVVASEQNPTVLLYSRRALESLAHLDAKRAEALVLTLSPRTATAEPPQDWVTRLIVLFGLRAGLDASRKRLESWVAGYAAEQEHLNAALFFMRDLFTYGYGSPTPEAAEAASRTREYTRLLVEALEPVLEKGLTAESEVTTEEKAAHALFHQVAQQFSFGVGKSETAPAALNTPEAEQQFLRSYAPIIRKLTRLGNPNAIHRLTQIINQFIEVEPELCFDLFSGAILHNANVFRYEQELLAIDQFIELLNEYLAGHRSIFALEDRRNKLIDCLTLFFDAGWPAAWQLFRNLPELLR